MYNEIAKGYNNLYKEEQLKKLNIIKQYFHPKPILLDLGCGTGIAMEFFNIESIGLDPSTELLKQAKGKVICGKAENIPFKDNYFNSLICLTAIHHCNLNKAINEIKRVCKGSICITVLKKAKKSKEITNKLIKELNLKLIEEEKDYILIK
ncbi:MAG: class I SAM-dependent methyltransferase [archaeon]